MGKIFGISDNPVSTIESALRGTRLEVPKSYFRYISKNTDQTDKFISKDKPVISNPIIKMRNGFGKLMSHFSKTNK